MSIQVPVSVGELIDKLTILEIKAQKIEDAKKLGNVNKERALLSAIIARELPASPELDELTSALRSVNEQLWAVEDELRALEAMGDFSAPFVEKARSVYLLNDERARIKQRINVEMGSELVEEKSYAQYTPSDGGGKS